MLTCPFCKGESGTSLVCEQCRHGLNPYQKHCLDVLWHKTIVEAAGFRCSYCNRYYPPDSGMLCGDHIIPKGSRPDLRWDITNGRSTCNECHGLRHSGSLSPLK